MDTESNENLGSTAWQSFRLKPPLNAAQKELKEIVPPQPLSPKVTPSHTNTDTSTD